MKRIYLFLTAILIVSTSAHAVTLNANDKKIEACSSKVSKSTGYDITFMLKHEKISKKKEAEFHEKEAAFTQGMEDCLKK